MTRNHTSIGIALRLFCAALLIALGFAHRPLAAPVTAIDMAAYTLPDGTVPTLCQPEGGKAKELSGRCDACRIYFVAIPAPPSEAIRIEPAAERAAFTAMPERFHRLHFPPSAPPRGPPAFPVSSLIA